MQWPCIRFRLWQIMIAVMAVALLLALPDGWGMIVLPALAIPFLGTTYALCLVFRKRRRLAMFAFWLPAALSNVLFAALCVSPEVYLLGFAFFVWLIFILPTTAVFGVAWAVLATREGSVWHRFPPGAWLAVVALAVLPLVTLWSFWPLRLAFLTVRPALNRLADQVAAGAGPSFPQWVGPFRVARSAVDPASGNVGLMIDPNPNGPTGLVRVCPGIPPNRRGPIGWDDLQVDLGWGWEYREED
jgi:hypothetical protein